MTIVWVSLGSNIGDRNRYLKNAIELISQVSHFSEIKCSSFHQTDSWGYKLQNYFLNAIVSFQTTLNMKECFFQLENIEKLLGREEKGRFEPRSIDIDLLFFGAKIFCDRSLVVPHPLLHLREFVLKPFCELDANFEHPVLKKSIAVLLSNLERKNDR